jgi:hypothetical protein
LGSETTSAELETATLVCGLTQKGLPVDTGTESPAHVGPGGATIVVLIAVEVVSVVLGVVVVVVSWTVDTCQVFG